MSGERVPIRWALILLEASTKVQVGRQRWDAASKSRGFRHCSSQWKCQSLPLISLLLELLGINDSKTNRRLMATV
jgi:hypothetical protein